MIKFIINIYKYLSKNSLLQIFINILILIFLVFICYVFFNFMYYFLGEFYFSIFIIIFICILIFTDTRIILRNKLIFLFLILLQFILYIYWNFLYIDFIKDMFWFGFILNISFIWHFLILNRLYNYLLKKPADYEILRFFISRLSYITSLSLLIIILRYFRFLLYLIFRYVKALITVFPESFKLKYKVLIWLHKKKVNTNCQLILIILESILFFFIKLFLNYNLLLVKNNLPKIKLNRTLVIIIILFVSTLIMSIITNIPRLYFLWGFIFIFNYINIFIESKNQFIYFIPVEKDIFNFSEKSYIIKLKWYQLPFYIKAWSSLLKNWYELIYTPVYGEYTYKIFEKWDLLYGRAFYCDLYCHLWHLHYHVEFISPLALYTFEYINIYDIFKIFWFDCNSYSVRTRLAVRILNLNFIQNCIGGCKSYEAAQEVINLKAYINHPEEYTLNLIEDSIKKNHLFLTVKEFRDLLFYNDNFYQYPLVWIDERKPITLIKYLFGLRSGTYIIVCYKRVESFGGIVSRDSNNSKD